MSPQVRSLSHIWLKSKLCGKNKVPVDRNFFISNAIDNSKKNKRVLNLHSKIKIKF